MNILEYKGYHGTVEPDLERGVMRGKLLFISDLVSFEAVTLPQLRQAFEEAVDDYLDTCASLVESRSSRLLGRSRWGQCNHSQSPRLLSPGA